MNIIKTIAAIVLLSSITIATTAKPIEVYGPGNNQSCLYDSQNHTKESGNCFDNATNYHLFSVCCMRVQGALTETGENATITT